MLPYWRRAVIRRVRYSPADWRSLAAKLVEKRVEAVEYALLCQQAGAFLAMFPGAFSGSERDQLLRAAQRVEDPARLTAEELVVLRVKDQGRARDPVGDASMVEARIWRSASAALVTPNVHRELPADQRRYVLWAAACAMTASASASRPASISADRAGGRPRRTAPHRRSRTARQSARAPRSGARR